MHLAFLWEENGLSSSNWKDLKRVELWGLFDHGPQTTEYVCSLCGNIESMILVTVVVFLLNKIK
jgi:hypothetical protein